MYDVVWPFIILSHYNVAGFCLKGQWFMDSSVSIKKSNKCVYLIFLPGEQILSLCEYICANLKLSIFTKKMQIIKIKLGYDYWSLNAIPRLKHKEGWKGILSEM